MSLVNAMPTNSPSVNYGENWERSCFKDRCSFTLVSGYSDAYFKNVISKSKDWSKYYIVRYLERDENFDIKIRSFNRTNFEFTLKTSVIQAFNSIPFSYCVENSCYKINYRLNGLEKDFRLDINPLNYENFTFGFSSTTITLDESNNANIGDTYVDEDTPNNNYGSIGSMYVRSQNESRNARTFSLWNLSVVPRNAEIINANLSLYLDFAPSHEDRYYEVWNTSTQNATGWTWTESGLTWNNQPLALILQDNITIPYGVGTLYKYWNVTNVTITAYSEEKNLSFVVKDSKESQNSTLYQGTFNTKESASLRPKLVIDYIPDTEPPKYFDNSTNDTTAGKPIEFRLRWTDNKGLDGYIFSLDNATAQNYTYNFSDTTNNKAWNNSVANKPPTTYMNISDTEFSSGSYTNISTSDNTYFNISSTDYPYHKFNFTINSSIDDIDTINISWEGHVSATANMYIYNFSSGSWSLLDSYTGTTDGWINASITSDFSDYVDDGKITILVQDPDIHLASENNSEDASVYANLPTSNYNYTFFYVGQGALGKAYWFYSKFNITPIPDSQQIDDAELCYYIYSNGYDTGETVVAWVYQVSDQTWIESEITWNSKPNTLALVYTNDSFNGYWVTFWICFDVTSWVSSEYVGGKDNVSFMFNSSLEDAYDYMLGRSSEYDADVSLRPHLNITYSPSIITRYLATDFIEVKVTEHSFKNITESAMTGTEDWSNTTHVVNENVDKTIKWRVYGNDSVNNWNTSEIYSFVTETAVTTTTTTAVTTIPLAIPIEDKRVLCFNSLDSSVDKKVNITQLNLRINDSENLEDTYIDESNADTNYGTNDFLFAVNSTLDKHFLVKINISPITSNTTIDSAIARIYMVNNYLDSGEGFSLSVHHHYNQTWQEQYPTWNNFNDLGSYNANPEDTIVIDENSLRWYNFSIKNMLQSEIDSGNSNLTIYFRTHDMVGSPSSIDWVAFYSKEKGDVWTQIPIFNITFSQTIQERMIESDFAKLIYCDLLEVLECFYTLGINNKLLRLTLCLS